jgi:hypothetical protein
LYFTAGLFDEAWGQDNGTTVDETHGLLGKIIKP